MWIFREREFTDPSSLVDTVYLKRLQNLVVLFSNLEVDFANFYPYVHVLSTYFSMWHYSDKSPNNCIRKLKTTGGCFRTLCYSTPSLDSAKLQYIMLESIHTPFSSVLKGGLRIFKAKVYNSWPQMLWMQKCVYIYFKNLSLTYHVRMRWCKILNSSGNTQIMTFIFTLK